MKIAARSFLSRLHVFDVDCSQLFLHQHMSYLPLGFVTFHFTVHKTLTTANFIHLTGYKKINLLPKQQTKKNKLFYFIKTERANLLFAASIF